MSSKSRKMTLLRLESSVHPLELFDQMRYVEIWSSEADSQFLHINRCHCGKFYTRKHEARVNFTYMSGKKETLPRWYFISWWRHQMETFSALLAIFAGNSPVPGEFPTQRPVTRSFDVYFDPRLNKRLCKQSWGWWFETLLCPLWRHSNVT